MFRRMIVLLLAGVWVTGDSLAQEWHLISVDGWQGGAAVVVDFDLDGDQDLVERTLTGFFWLENDGSGNFTQHNPDLPVSTYSQLQVADLDSDGDMDVLTLQTADVVNWSVYWFENDGAMNFSESIIAEIPTMDWTAFTVADFTLDGLPDIMLLRQIEQQSSNYRIYYQFAPLAFGVYADAFTSHLNSPLPALTSQDMDGDGRPDAFSNCPLDNVAFVDDTQITVSSAVQMEGVIPAAGDIDGDGLQDIVYADYGPLYCNLQATQRVFGDQITLHDDGSDALATLDWNADGMTDVAAATGAQFRVYTNEGDLEFSSESFTPPVGYGFPFHLLTGDLDGDDDLDLIGKTFSGYTWLENPHGPSRTPEAPPQRIELAMNVYPNPFNATATVAIDLPYPSQVNLTLVNTLGQVVWSRPNVQAGAGLQQFSVDGSFMTSGTYLLRAEIGTAEVTQRMVLLK
ncbi:T9SS type A sorting domain-containing protein [bacterium]|nr:T9SS type A sorting domain-containing protein [bacterium]